MPAGVSCQAARLARWLLLASLALLGACASYQANRPDVANRVEAMLAEREYTRALQTIDLVKPDHPDFRRLRGWRVTINKRAADFEREITSEVDDMMDDGQWHNAGLRLDEGLGKLPRSEPLTRKRDEFLTRRNRELARINRDLMLARGRGLPAEIAALESLAGVDPTDQELVQELERRRGMLSEAQRGLIDCGRSALARGQNERALECLDVARSIGQSEEVNRLLAASQKTKTARKAKVRAAEQEREERDQARRIQDLRKAYAAAQKNGNLLASRKHLDTLLKLQPSAALRQDSVRLDARIKRRVERGLEDGRNLYTQGDFKGARAIWVAALRLEPGNQELKDNIARAERVLKKLQTLSSDQKSTN